MTKEGLSPREKEIIREVAWKCLENGSSTKETGLALEEVALALKMELHMVWKEYLEHKHAYYEEQAKVGHDDVKILDGRVIRIDREHCRVFEHYRMKDRPFEQEIVNAIVTVQEEELHESQNIIERYFVIEIKFKDRTLKFRCSSSDFASNQSLETIIHRAAGSRLIYVDINTLKKAIKVCSSNVSIIHSTEHLGWQEDGTFLTPSVLIDKEGIREAKDKKIIIDPVYNASLIDFTIKPVSEVKEVSKVFLDNFERLNSPEVTGFVLAISFLTPIHSKFRTLNKFTLWITGSTGDGKTFLLTRSQDLFTPGHLSELKTLISTTSSISFIRKQAYYFKDCPIALDDYKQVNLSLGSKHELCQFLSNLQDATSRGTLTINRNVGPIAQPRGIVICNGEDSPPLDAGVTSRILIVNFQKRERDFEAGKNLLNLGSRTSSIMPHYINWFLNQNIEEYQKFYQESSDKLFEIIKGSQNDARISFNVAQIRLGYKCAIDFFTSLGAISREDATIKLSAFDNVLAAYIPEMAKRVHSIYGANNFIQTLSSLLSTGEVIITQEPVGLELEEGYKKRIVGYIKKSADYSNVFCIIPDAAYGAVERALKERGESIGFSKQALGNQLKAENHLASPIDGNMRKVRIGKQSIYCWPIKRASLGFVLDKEKDCSLVNGPILNFPISPVDGII